MDSVIAIRTDLEIAEGGSTVTGHYAAMREPLASMRIDVFDGKQRVWSEGLDIDGPWNMPQSAAAPSRSEKGVAALTHGIQFNLYGIEHIPSLGGALQYLGRQTVGGTDYHVIRAVLADGFATAFYIDPATWLIGRRRDVRPLHPDIDMTFKPFETEFSDYRPVGGIQTAFASAQTDLIAGKIVQTTVNTSFAYNPALAPAALARYAPPL